MLYNPVKKHSKNLEKLGEILEESSRNLLGILKEFPSNVKMESKNQLTPECEEDSLMILRDSLSEEAV